MIYTTIISYLISAVLGVWSASLLWRLVVERAERRRALRRSGAAPSISFTPRQRRLGVALIGVCLPLSIAVVVFAEWVSSWDGVSFTIIDAFIVAVASLFFVLAAGAVCAGWFFDPPRGRRRCPTCWYELAGVPDLCTECGRRDIPEHLLHRTRRSRPLVALGLALMLVAAAVQFVRLERAGRAAAVIPTSVMIAALPWLTEGMLTGDAGSLTERLSQLRPSQSQLDRLRARCRGVLQSSTSPDLLVRTAALYGTFLRDDDVGPFPQLNQQAAASAIADLFAPDQRTADLAAQRMATLRPFIPTLDAARASTLLPVMRTAMTSPNSPAADAAFRFAPKLGAVAEPLLPLAVRRFENPKSSSQQVEAIELMLALSVFSDLAWRRFVLSIEAAPALLMDMNAGGALIMAENANLFERRLLELLDHKSDLIAAWAVSAVGAHTDRVIEVMEARPAVAAMVVRTSSIRVWNEKFVLFVVRMLESEDASLRDAAIQFCFIHPDLGEHFLPALRRVRENARRGTRAMIDSVINRAVAHNPHLAEPENVQPAPGPYAPPN